jgi:hypothetical protein
MFTKLTELKTAYTNNDLVPLLIGSGYGLLGWMGMTGGVTFENALPTFWKSTGSWISIVSGIFAAIYAGYATIDSSVKSEYWSASSQYKGANYLGYANNGWMSVSLGAFEVTWVIAFLVLLIEIVLAPFYIGTKMDLFYARKADSLTGADKAQFDWFALGLNMLVAFGGWTAALALKNSTTTLINYFDIQNTDSAALYQAAFPTGQDATIDSSIALLTDLSNHSVIVFFYYALGAVISNCAYWFSNEAIKQGLAQ